MARRANRLAQETSPYLLQHAHNPVDWYSWGDEALTRAKAEDKPILLSIGYSACHWCHVMERESFENDAIAKQMNESFICIKVDREERPDLDEIYMGATIALSGSGGWPMTVFLTPDTEPFFGGTYFPPEDRQGRPGFPALLTRVAQMWKGERQSLLDQAKELTEHVRGSHALLSAGGISEDALRAASRSLARSFDESFGGFGGAPKFPAPTALSLLLRTFRRTGKRDLLHMVTHTLDGMMSGGMYDQLGGGFARYSVDRTWLVPHFEKMLYDNAQLADVYIEGFQATGHVPYRRVARETLDYALREMQSPGGGFLSASDADTDGVEGKYYVFTKTEIEKAVGQPAATHFCAFHGVTDDGNFDGTNVLTARRNLAQVAKEFGIDQAVLLESLEIGREKLLALRATRTAPDVDDKVITSWNGLMIRALANGARAFSEPRYLEAACRAADFILASAEDGDGMRREDGGLYRTSRAGRAHINGFLEDYAFVADGLLSLYEAGGGERYLFEAQALTERFIKDFRSEDDGALYSTPSDGEALISRPRSGSDAAIPSANAVACSILGRLSFHFDRPEWRAQATRIASSFASTLKRSPRAFCGLLCAVDFLLEAPLEIVLSGDPQDEHFREMSIALGARYLPNRVEARLGVPPRESSALAAGRFEEGAPTKVYLCTNFSCKTPVTSAPALGALLDETEKQRLDARAHELGSHILPGRATTEGTEARRASGKLPASAYRALDSLSVSRLSVGTHRIGLDEPEHHRALTKALSSGLNLIDTSPSFAFGDSERLVGQVLRELCGAETIERSQIVIVSKVGVALGAAAEGLEVRRKSGGLTFACPLGAAGGNASAETTLTSGAFCLDPLFLGEQIAGSLERLGLDHLDVCLIQSPEHMLAAGQPRDALETALVSAFSTLEEEVATGRIGRYGVLCNTVTRPNTDPLSIDLEWLAQLARKSVGKDNHFRVLELPVNVGETGALDSTNGESIVERATKLGISTLACRPLSPVVAGALLRLVDPPASPDGATAESLRSARYKVASLEAEFETTFAAQLRLTGRADAGAILPLSGPLGQALEQTATRQQFELAEATMVSPRLRQLLSQLDRAFAGPGDQKWAAFRNKYIAAIGGWLAAVRETTTEKNRVLLTELSDALKQSAVFAAHLPNTFDELPWVERALGLLLNEEHLTTVLVGLRHVDQVDAAIALLNKS